MGLIEVSLEVGSSVVDIGEEIVEAEWDGLAVDVEETRKLPGPLNGVVGGSCGGCGAVTCGYEVVGDGDGSGTSGCWERCRGSQRARSWSSEVVGTVVGRQGLFRLEEIVRWD